MKAKWTSDDVPGQRGRLAVVTGANTGLGVRAISAVVLFVRVRARPARGLTCADERSRGHGPSTPSTSTFVGSGPFDSNQRPT